jgi:hypothetical protein
MHTIPTAGNARFYSLVPDVNGHNDEHEEEFKLRTMLAFSLGIGGGPEGHGMPRDVFRGVLDMLMPSWDPLRYRSAETERLRLSMLSLAGEDAKIPLYD